jgi:tetratricopeptide (TPR) repeat protein
MKQTVRQPLHIVWEGAFLARHSLALVNRELVTALHRLAPEWQFYLVPHPTDDGVLRGAPRWRFIEERMRRLPSHVDVWIRHHWPPNWQRPNAEHFVVIQPWEFGSIPKEWVEAINRNVDELWVPSTFVRECYVRDGVQPEKVAVVPNGVSEGFFEPVPPMELPTQKRFRFLYVGGTIPRKGIDILLDGYTRTFTRSDDVALVIKDFGVNTFYRGQNYVKQIRWFQQQPDAPEIVYIADELDEQQMNALYRACHALVHPYRGEGFGLPIAEAMACGLPVIVTGFGAAMDFCNEERAWLIPSGVEYFPDNLVGDMETVNRPFWAKPERNAMEALMEQVYRDDEGAKAVAERAARWVRENLTWDRAAQVAAERLSHSIQSSSGEDAESVIYRAAECVAQEDYDEAIVLLERLVREQPQQLKAYCGLGVAYFQAGSIARAEGVLRQGLQVGEDFELHHHLAYILLQTGRSQEALHHAIRAVELNPECEEAIDLLRGLSAKLQKRFLKRGKHALHNELQRASHLLQQSGAAALPAPSVSQSTASRATGAKKAHPTISLCMIARDEEAFIEDCLQSVQGLVDEIVLVDTGSTDRTVQIAQRYGAKIVHHPWRDDFSEARNVSLQHATGDWVLWLDADERLDRGSAEAIRNAIRDPQFVGYLVEIVNEVGDPQSSSTFVHRACRLFRRLPVTRFEGRIHEQVVPSLQRNGYEVAYLKGVRIRHLGYRQDIVADRRKHERTIRLLREEVQKNPEDLFQRFNLGNAYYVAGQYAEAVRELEPIVDRIEPYADHAAIGYVLLANALYPLGQYERILQVHERAIRRGIDHPGLYFADGYACLALRRYAESVEAFQKAIAACDDDRFVSGDTSISGFKAYYGLAQAYLGLEQLEQSEAECRRALEEQPTFAEARYLLAQLLFTRGEGALALKELEQAHRDAPHNAEIARELAVRYEQAERWADAYAIWRRLVSASRNNAEYRWHSATCAEKLNLWQEAQADYTELTVVHPQFAPAWVNLGRVHLAQGDYEGALSCFTRAIELNPEDANAFFNAGDVLYQLGAYEAAAETYTAGLQRDPHNAQGFFTLGNAYFQMGAYEAAMMAFQQALALQPDHYPARHNLELVKEQMKGRVA